MIELVNVSDIKIAEFVGIKETKTLRNWKKVPEDGSKFIGKQNLYKACKLHTYLFWKSDYAKKEERNIDVLLSGAKILENNLNIDTTHLDEHVKAAIAKSNLDAISNVKAILNDITKIDNTGIKVE